MNEIQVWHHRIRRVEELVKFVQRHMEDDKDKAEQYVYANLMIGKMKYPQSPDPVFAPSGYADETLEARLGPKNLIEYKKIKDANLPTEFVIVLSKDLLFLRYKCVGVENNLHASITMAAADQFKSFTECFASPYNHKLETYFSIFEADKQNNKHCKGNFFSYVKENGGILPPGEYYMNPPWINEFYMEIAEILEKGGFDKTVIIVAPPWPDPQWKERFNLLKANFRYSKSEQKRVAYNKGSYALSTHDRTRPKLLNLETAYWIFSNKPIRISL